MAMNWKSLAKFMGSPQWKLKAAKVNQRLTEFYRMFKTKKYATPDDLFFAIEDLPSLGKEYWFLHFCAPPNEEQVVLTLGRSVDPVKVNQTQVDFVDRDEGVPCAAVCWYYSQGKKKVVFDSIANVSLPKNSLGQSLKAKNGGSNIVFSGKYPNFNVELVLEGKKVFSAKAMPPKHGTPYELVHLLSTPLVPRFGAAMINYYFDFEGMLEGKLLSGKAYLQKVVAVLPLAPWNWVRLQFENGSALDFFAGKPLGEKSKMHFACNDYFEIEGRRIKMRDLKLSSYLSGEKRIWILSGKNLYVAMESYSLQPFIMQQKTTFRYDEYIVKVRAFALKDGPREYTLSDLGQGVGMVEDASGYLF
jgi:hypothetical protein